MGKITTFEATKAVVRRNTEEAEHAPPPEPIRGYFSDSWVEPVFLGSLWVLNALGALPSPLSLVKWNRRVVGVALSVGARVVSCSCSSARWTTSLTSVLYLCSDNAKFTTGTSLVVDGGFIAQ
jgi:hypothetical protein